ncbi:MAG: ABC transporter permease subunit [Bacillota bacterium]|nr:ABC transporter permease subunit [Bacillota bacterium]
MNQSGIKRKETMKRLKRYSPLYLLLLPALAYIVVFNYMPMYGVQIAFKNYRSSRGIFGSDWVGIENFVRFLTYPDFWNLIRNTLRLSLYSLATFPCALLLALSINEVRNYKFRKTVQMVTYMPHFISTVVLVGMLNLFFSQSNGLINNLLEIVGIQRLPMLTAPRYFSHLYIWSGVWQNIGWGSIIYVAALSSVSPELIEAARIDGASRMQVIWHVNIPSILPTIVILLILSTGNILSVGFEKVYLMQNAMNISVSQIISTYVYEVGLISGRFSYSAAIGLFNNVINVIVLLIVNQTANKISGTSLF